MKIRSQVTPASLADTQRTGQQVEKLCQEASWCQEWNPFWWTPILCERPLYIKGPSLVEPGGGNTQDSTRSHGKSSACLHAPHRGPGLSLSHVVLSSCLVRLDSPLPSHPHCVFASAVLSSLLCKAPLSPTLPSSVFIYGCAGSWWLWGFL